MITLAFRHIYSTIRIKTRFSARNTSLRCCHGTKVTIGDVSIVVQPPKNPQLVPTGYLEETQLQSILRHLKWIMQKDQLEQDIFLIGVSGPYRRRIVFQYLELMQKEVEYVALTRDTTESDLKQRREIRSGVSLYLDQAAVKAAVEGRVLVLEGIEKAERNVLPVLNNLLENREMQLDDGRFLVSSTRYDKLLQDFTKETLDEWKLVRVSENFRVFALGLPVPPYRGNPLDPPLRSRFQSRDFRNSAYEEQLESLCSRTKSVSQKRVSDVLSFVHSLLATEAQVLGLPDFPIDNLGLLVDLMNQFPDMPFQQLIERVYPKEILNKEGKKAILDALGMFNLTAEKNVGSKVTSIQGKDNNKMVVFQVGRKSSTVEVFGGSLPQEVSSFVPTKYHDNLLAEVLQSHTAHDICLIGPKGCGKTAIVNHLANLLGYETELVLLYQDMSARDIIQQRTTLPNGDTTWTDTPLVNAALTGKLAILDGVHRLHPSTLAQLQRLVQDRELQLFDGKRLIRADRYEQIKSGYGFTDEDMKQRNIFKVDPSFRIIALAEPPSKTSGSGIQKDKWLTPEVLSMFLFHSIRPLSLAEEKTVIEKCAGSLSDKMSSILKLAHKFRDSSDPTLQSISSSLSTRQLLRIAHRFAQYPDSSVVETVNKAVLARFLPPLAKQALDRALEDEGLSVKESSDTKETVRCEVKDGVVHIGNTTIKVYEAGSSQVKVPDTLFYDNQQHAMILEAMLQDFLLGEHLLLVGNQGVGKNKIVDRFLNLINWPREYIQLHRDTSVQSLTLQPTIKDGIITYEDSPLVSAVQKGHILVVDEADKAPTHVTCVLKALVESGEMLLADGRRIVHASDNANRNKPNVIVMHPNFRMIVLANRPGFPFLGNDFFGSLGDIFSCHAVDNPSRESEKDLLHQYGPSVPDEIIEKLLDVFEELRKLSDQGLIAYPYSTREVVNVVKHMQKYPDDGLAQVLKNVFDFDTYNSETRKVLHSVLHKHGIPIDSKPSNVILGKKFDLQAASHISNWVPERVSNNSFNCSVQEKQLQIGRPFVSQTYKVDLERTEARSLYFSELQYYWNLPLESSNSSVTDVAISKSKENLPVKDIIHAAAVHPLNLYSINPGTSSCQLISLQRYFSHGYGVPSALSLAALGSSLQGMLVIHEPQTNTLLLSSPLHGEVSQISLKSFLGSTAEKLNRSFYSFNSEALSILCCDLAEKNILAVYQPGRHDFDVFNMETYEHLCWNLPITVDSLNMLNESQCLITTGDINRKYILSWDAKSPSSHSLYPISENLTGTTDPVIRQLYAISPNDLPEEVCAQVADGKGSKIARVLATEQDFAAVAAGCPDTEQPWTIYSYPRKMTPWGKATVEESGTSKTSFMMDSSILINRKGVHSVPSDAVAQGIQPENASGYLEVVNLNDQTVRYIPVPRPSSVPYYSKDTSTSKFVMAPGSRDTLVTVDIGGCIRTWELSTSNLEHSLSKWKKMMGHEKAPLQLTIEGKGEISGPKHGKIDPKNTPHVGGNTWAGGTGGRDTAGLGGVGGPYRLDAGHNVHQVPDEVKEGVPPEVIQAAREMAQKALKDRLAEIEMSEYDAALYEQFASNVQRQIHLLRVILDSLQAKGKERQWLKHQTSGELDDSKLIEGLTGERTIYRRRGEQEPEVGSPQLKPKRLRLVVDVSGSMYRFNGYDGRLEREMEAVLMAMEALEGYQNKFVYDVLGHSGEEVRIDFVKPDKPPSNNKERLKVLQAMHAHSQYCVSGDCTLPATEEAIKSLAAEDCDEYFVIVLSDANFDRYGISSKHFATALTSDPNVNAFAVFIGSLGDQAMRLQKRLPAGRTFVCMDTKELPQILQQIFTSSLLNTAT